jgi:serine/threonine-protein kinase RsbW/stage II sporulation protein AB (anti-sigma F factor)
MVRTWRAVPDAVVELRRAVVDFARHQGARDETLSSIRLAVSEAASNVVLHAYSGAGEPGPVHVLAEREGAGLRVVVSDDGAGMLPRPDSPGLGLGLPLIAQLVDGLEVARTPSGGTALCMRFRL